MRVFTASLLCALGLAACAPCATQSTLTGLDGGAVACVSSADCPTPGSTLLCASTEDHLRGCVDCQAGQCVRYTPGSCK